MGFSQAPGLPYSKLGIVEDGDTASQSIEKDKYVIWKGDNYFAKTDIQQGETFVVDTNLTEITEGAINGLAEALKALTTPVLLGSRTSNGIITLSEAISNFTYVYMELCTGENDSVGHCMAEIVFTSVWTLKNIGNVNTATRIWGGTVSQMGMKYVSDTEISVENYANVNTRFMKVWGIR